MIRGEAGLCMKATKGSFSAQLGSSSPIGVSRQIKTLGHRKQAITVSSGKIKYVYTTFFH
jgi:hypothetical protein